MKIRQVKKQVRDFVFRNTKADAIQVMIYEGDLIVDIAEFHQDWNRIGGLYGGSRGAGVADWVAERRNCTACEIKAFNLKDDGPSHETVNIPLTSW